MASKTHMEELSIQQLIEKYNFIVPEIQREYVWGKNDFNILDSFYDDIKEKVKAAENENSILFEGLKIDIDKIFNNNYNADSLIKINNAIEKFKSNSTINIGFLYSYKPSYYVYNDTSEDVYLIDGQQRFTTLVLSLLYFALKENDSSIKENKLSVFINAFRIDIEKETIAFDYRVRNLTHSFVIDLIKNVKDFKDINTISIKTWFLSEYAKDVTINAMLGTFDKLHEKFEHDKNNYFDFLFNQVKFWHFKTEETSQGEELYITMNSRGKSLADNEILRSNLFGKLAVEDSSLMFIREDYNESKDISGLKKYWGIKWEKWQDYFWEKKSGKDADKGFNEFLFCIAGFENYKSENKTSLSYEIFRDNGINVFKLIELLDLTKIERYLDYFVKISDTIAYCKSQYTYYKWTDNFNEEWWSLFNTDSTNWFADLDDVNRGTEHSRMVFVWSIFEYFLKVNDPNKLNDIRFLRLFYLRYKNYDRSVTFITTRITSIVHDPVFAFYTSEELMIYNYIKSIKNNDNQKEVESIIWEIEDHPYNIDGRDLKAINISHLVDFNKKPTKEDLDEVKTKFYALFPIDNLGKNSKLIRTTLLYYGTYWKDISLSYYDRYSFDNWKRIIRNVDGDSEAFKEFFLEIGSNTVTSFLNYKKLQFLIKKESFLNKATDTLPEMHLREQLIIYSILIEDLWSAGNYIAVYEETTEKRLFKNENRVIYNTKGDFRGNSGYVELWLKCKKEVGDDTKKIVLFLNNKMLELRKDLELI